MPRPQPRGGRAGTGHHRGPRMYLQVAKGQARALATISPALVVDPVQDGEAVQAVALEGAQRSKQPGEQVVSGDPGNQERPSASAGPWPGGQAPAPPGYPQKGQPPPPPWPRQDQKPEPLGLWHPAGPQARSQTCPRGTVQCEMSGLNPGLRTCREAGRPGSALPLVWTGRCHSPCLG